MMSRTSSTITAMAKFNHDKQAGMEPYELKCPECHGTGNYWWQDEYSTTHCERGRCGKCKGTGSCLPELEIDWVDINPPIYSIPITRYKP